MSKKNYKSSPAISSSKYREAADQVWNIARKYEEKGHKKLAWIIKDLATELHEIARKKEITENLESKPI